MLALITNVQKLDWDGWLRGAIGALVSGGAGAVGSGVAANILDKGHDLNILALMGTTFLVSGIVSLAKFLQTTPVPTPIPPTPPVVQ